MIMLHFSSVEVSALASSSKCPSCAVRLLHLPLLLPTQRTSSALSVIASQNMLGLFLFGPAALATLLWGLYAQLVANKSSFATLLLILFLTTCLYLLYEGLRLGAIRSLQALSTEKVVLMAIAADKRNQQALRRDLHSNSSSSSSSIDVTATDTAAGFIVVRNQLLTHPVAAATGGRGDNVKIEVCPSSSSNNGNNNGNINGNNNNNCSNLLSDKGLDTVNSITGRRLPGYRRIYFVLTLFAATGVLSVFFL